MADMDIELAVDGLARDLGLVLVDDGSFDRASAAAGTDLGERCFVDFLELLGWRPMAVPAVGLTALTAGAFGVEERLASAEGSGLPFASATSFVKQAGQFFHPPFQLSDAPVEGLASRAVGFAHAAIVGARWAGSCAS
jgi:hypothetical protein